MKNWNKLKKENACEIYQYQLAHSFLDKICEIMDKKNINQKELAGKMGLSQSQISRLLGGDGNLTIKTLAKLFFALDEEIKVLTKSEYKKDNKMSSLHETLESSIFQTSDFELSIFQTSESEKRNQMNLGTYSYRKSDTISEGSVVDLTPVNRELKYGT